MPRRSAAPLLALASLVPLLAACTGAEPPAAREPDERGGEDPLLAGASVPHVVVREAFLTAATPQDNVDSPAAWVAGDGRIWLLATAKEGERVLVYDGETGVALDAFGTAGSAPGQLRRANGIFVHDDLALVVERDNRRVQVFSLPDFRPLAMFGQEELVQPYGIWVRDHGNGQLEVLVSDAYMDGQDADGEDRVPPLAALGERIKRYLLEVGGGQVTARPAGAFGDTGEAGAIRIPESLWGDPANDRLLVAEEDTAVGTGLREYSLAGEFRGRSIGVGGFQAQAEGIALWACPDGSGYWIATDQYKDRSLFHLYERRSLAPAGAFAGEQVANTDGVWLHQAPTARFPAGVFYAVHDDMAVAAFDWRDVARALGLPEACAAPPPA